MCGFVGWINRDPRQPVDPALLARMNRMLAHRGPDDEGLHVDGPVGLAHRRLSVIDLSANAAQPLFNEDKTVAVVFNGEIYNYPALRRELVLAGHVFTTQSDTEILVHGWEEWRENLVPRLDGMFAFAIFDRTAGQLFLARDRFGKKPLFYAFLDDAFLFSSEIKALREHPGFDPEPDPVAIRQFFAHDYIPSPRTIYRRCRKMRPACSMSLPIQRLDDPPVETEYWQLAYEDKISPSSAVAVEHARTLLRDAVERRLMSDVPLGALLSGGLDSSTVVALMRRIMPDGDIQTFSIGFPEATYDETSYARTIAGCFRTTHHELVVTGTDVVNELGAIHKHMDEPFADNSILPTALLCRFARERVTVALGGEGGDELLAGYEPFRAYRLLGRGEAIIRLFRPALRQVEKLLSATDRNMSRRFKLHHFLQGFPPEIPRGEGLHLPLWMASLPPEEQAEFFRDNKEEFDWREIFAASLRAFATPTFMHPVDRMIQWYLKVYLHDDILAKVDRAGMMHSLEVRSPFLDTAFAEYTARLPVRFKIRWNTRKALLRQMMRGILPDSILARKKKGFAMPVAAWLRGELRPLLREMSDENLLRRQDLFEPAAVGRMLNEHLDGKTDHRKQLWAFLSFQLWANEHGLL